MRSRGINLVQTDRFVARADNRVPPSARPSRITANTTQHAYCVIRNG